MPTNNKTFLSIKLILLFFSGASIIGCGSKSGNTTTPPTANGNNTTTPTSVIQFVFTSDPHYGLTKANFQGQTNVDAHIVNAAMINKINTLPNTVFPNDGGVQAGKQINEFDGLIQTGDIANREEKGIQSASVSWSQYATDFIQNLTLKNKVGQTTPIYYSPGNHDVSDAIGYYNLMAPPTDPTTMVDMYNLMMNNNIQKTIATYDYATDKIHYSKDIQGIHFMFVNLWPDSTERIWMNTDLQNVSTTTPVLIFCHSNPDVDASFFTNPNGAHDINAIDQFENLLPELYQEGNINNPSTIEQIGFVNFIKTHPNIKAYFHGHSNYTQYYYYKGPNSDISLPCFRVDSPLKGKYSATDETKLSFEVIAIDTSAMSMTVRECLWNPTPGNPNAPVTWGSSVTVSLR